MNKKGFITAAGATCKNWTWSWSYVNHEERVVIFGAWDKHTDGSKALIFGESWQRNTDGKKRPAFAQSREHIRLIEEEGYTLKTFPIIYSDEKKRKDGTGPSKIAAFTPVLTHCALRRAGGDWYAERRS
jgi:5-methylcytosine-specific restriction protein A